MLQRVDTVIDSQVLSSILRDFHALTGIPVAILSTDDSVAGSAGEVGPDGSLASPFALLEDGPDDGLRADPGRGGCWLPVRLDGALAASVFCRVDASDPRAATCARLLVESLRLALPPSASRTELSACLCERSLFFETALDLLCEADPEGRIIMVNPQWERVLGWKPDELRGRRLTEFAHPDDRGALATAGPGDDALAGPSGSPPERAPESEPVVRLRARDGSYRHFHWRARLAGAMIVAAARDVTERVLGEEALKDGEALYRSLFEGMAEAVMLARVVPDPGGGAADYVVLDVNPAFERVLGVPVGHAVGHRGSELFPTADPASFDMFYRVTESGAPESLELYSRRISRHLHVSATSPRPGCFLAVITDITARKRAEMERDRVLAELAGKNRDLERYLYVASHDLRSPLVNVQGFSAQLSKAFIEIKEILDAAPLEPGARERVEEILNARTPRALGFILSSTRRMDNLIQGLLTLSRTGRVEMSEEPLDMTALVREVVGTMRHAVESAGAEVEVGELPPCHGDRNLLGAAFANLVDNALKYRSPERRPRVMVGGAFDGEWVRYTVDDNGPGVPPEKRERLFELFYRGDPETKVPGEGIGLAQVRMIAERHRGTVRAGEAPGGGARFTLSLRLPGPPGDGETGRT